MFIYSINPLLIIISCISIKRRSKNTKKHQIELKKIVIENEILMKINTNYYYQSRKKWEKNQMILDDHIVKENSRNVSHVTSAD